MSNNILFENDSIYHADIVLTQEWLDKIKPRDFYFKDSTIGNTYRILFNKKTKYLYHAETEYSSKTLQPIIDDLKLKTFDSVLLMGLGTGQLIKKIREFSDCSITVIERDSQAQHYRHTVADDNFKLICGDVYNYNSFSRILQDYDIVIDDISPVFEYKIPFLKYNTRQSYYFMINYNHFPYPYNFLKINKLFSINRISEVDQNTVDFYQKMMYTLI